MNKIIEYYDEVIRSIDEELSYEDKYNIMNSYSYITMIQERKGTELIIDKLKELAYSSLKKKGEYILDNLSPETEHLKRYANMWLHSYSQFKDDPIKNDRLFFNAPSVIFVTSPSPINGGLASSNMELMTDALGLGTFFSGFLLVASQDNKEILDLLNIKDGKQIISCLVIGYPNVKYQRTVPRKEANVNWI